MYARSTTFRAQSSPIDADIAHVRDTVMPALEGIEGYIGLSLLVDRPSRRCIATSSWRSEGAMRASAEAVRPVRDRPASFSVAAQTSRNGRSLSCTVTTGRTWAPVSEPPGQGRPRSDRPSHRFL